MAEKLYYSIYPFSSTIVSHPGDHYLFLKHVMTEIFMLVALCAGLAPQVYEQVGLAHFKAIFRDTLKRWFGAGCVCLITVVEA